MEAQGENMKVYPHTIIQSVSLRTVQEELTERIYLHLMSRFHA